MPPVAGALRRHAAGIGSFAFTCQVFADEARQPIHDRHTPCLGQKIGVLRPVVEASGHADSINIVSLDAKEVASMGRDCAFACNHVSGYGKAMKSRRISRIRQT
jgi:hypothetical protein